VSTATANADIRLTVGTAVDVLCTFNDEWISGFEICSVDGHSYRVLRLFDMEMIPDPIPADRLRPA
jgi:hypothetical protein